MLVIERLKKRHYASTFNPGVIAYGGVATGEQKTVQVISGGISAFYTIYFWVQRFINAVTAIISEVPLHEFGEFALV